MDNQLLFDLFTKTIATAKILNKDADLMAKFQQIKDRLAPMQIGRLGQLQEWMGDWDSPSDHNRHVSHLYGMGISSIQIPFSGRSFTKAFIYLRFSHLRFTIEI